MPTPRIKAWYFSREELMVMEKALTYSIDQLGDLKGEGKQELRNDLRMCIDGIL